MKVSIRCFDELLLEVVFDRFENDLCHIQKVFFSFPDRPAKPHVSLFLNGDVLRPHFTAARNRPDQFRGWLPKVSSTALAGSLKHFASAAVRQAAGSFEAVNFRTLEEEGWSIHWADQRALQRWVQRAQSRSRELRLDSNTVVALMAHVFRHAALPTLFESIAPKTNIGVLALRFNETSEPELRLLAFFPDGFGALDTSDKPYVVHPPGWYWQPFEGADEDTMKQIFPSDKIKRAAEQLDCWLSRYPRRRPASDAELDQLPSVAMEIFGFYASDLLTYALTAIRNARAKDHILVPECRL